MSVVAIAARLGLHRAGREWRGACPCCGYPAAFVLSGGTGGRPLGWCSSCQNRAGIAAALAGADGYQPRPAIDHQLEDKAAATARKTARAMGLWAGAEPVPGTPAEIYLRTRRVEHVASSAALRFRADCPHPSGGRLPALLARIDNLSGELVAIHRTYLRRDGSGKAQVEPQKASLGPMQGGAIRLDPSAPAIIVAEGIESAVAAGKLCRLPAWSAVSAGNMARAMVLPEVVRSIVISVDRDPAGERAAREAAWRWKREGRHVRLLKPNRAGADASDVLIEAANV
ncbi:MAG: DUF7146 domain-containing protein [Acetobacteraceae bacterium]